MGSDHHRGLEGAQSFHYKRDVLEYHKARRSAKEWSLNHTVRFSRVTRLYKAAISGGNIRSIVSNIIPGKPTRIYLHICTGNF
jgi:hypothetical protein